MDGRQERANHLLHNLLTVFMIIVVFMIGSYVYKHMDKSGYLKFNIAPACDNPDAVETLEDNGIPFFSSNKCDEVIKESKKDTSK